MSLLPAEFIESLAALGPAAEGLSAVLEAGDATVSVRVNRAKGAAVPGGAVPVAWSAAGFYLDDRPLFAADPAWHQGRYYVQDASSMAVEAAVAHVVKLLDNRSALRVLDACAAPGGKTVGTLAALPGDAFVVANEADSHRANILAENIGKSGAPNVAVTRGPAQKFAKLPGAFDIITADVPCSGEGMMRKEEVAVSQWSPALVADCARLQREIVDAMWKALRPGGYIIYSTCTFNRSENEENIRYLADTYGAESVDLPLGDFAGVVPGIDTDLHCYRFMPGRVRGEGLFVAALRKPCCDEPVKKSRNTKPVKEEAAARGFLNRYLADADNYVASGSGAVFAVPRAHAVFADMLAEVTQVLRPGLPVAVLKGRELAPVHELALSTALKPDVFPALPLDRAAALEYLRGETSCFDTSALPTGYFTPTYQGFPLGLAKNIGRRANNLYPAAMRLRLDTAVALAANTDIL